MVFVCVRLNVASQQDLCISLTNTRYALLCRPPCEETHRQCEGFPLPLDYSVNTLRKRKRRVEEKSLVELLPEKNLLVRRRS